MSTVRSYTDYQLDPNSTPSALIADLKARIVTRGGWQLLHEDTSASPYIDVIPPADEAVGNSRSREVVRLRAPASGLILEMHTYLEAMCDVSKQVFVIGVNTASPVHSWDAGQRPTPYPYAGNATNNWVSINGSQVSAAVGATANATCQNLYNALVASTDAGALLFDYAFTAPGGTADAYITATAKSYATNATIAVAALDQHPGWTPLQASAAPGSHLGLSFRRIGTLPVDYTYGFLLYVSALGRSLLLATKTNAALYGPLFASYAANAVAVGITPAGLCPIELVAGDLSAAAAKGEVAGVMTHVWGYCHCNKWVYQPAPADNNYVNAAPGHRPANVVTGVLQPNGGTLQDLLAFYVDAGGSAPYPVGGLADCLVTIGGLRTDSANDHWANLGRPPIASCGVVGGQDISVRSSYPPIGPNGTVSSVYLSNFVPGLPLPDVCVYMGAANNEGLKLVRSTTATTLQTEMDATSDYATLTLGSTADLPASGTLVIGDECIPYTGKSGATVTGCTRSAYATAKAAHAVDEQVYLGAWVVKINGGVLHCGSTKPSN